MIDRPRSAECGSASPCRTGDAIDLQLSIGPPAETQERAVLQFARLGTSKKHVGRDAGDLRAVNSWSMVLPVRAHVREMGRAPRQTASTTHGARARFIGHVRRLAVRLSRRDSGGTASIPAPALVAGAAGRESGQLAGAAPERAAETPRFRIVAAFRAMAEARYFAAAIRAQPARSPAVALVAREQRFAASGSAAERRDLEAGSGSPDSGARAAASPPDTHCPRTVPGVQAMARGRGRRYGSSCSNRGGPVPKCCPNADPAGLRILQRNVTTPRD